MTDLPDVRLRALTNFPVSVTGRTGISVVKINGRWYIDLDVSDLVESANIPAEQVDQYVVTIYNKILDSYTNVPYEVVAAAGVASIDGHSGLLDIGDGLTFTGDTLEKITASSIANLKALSAIHTETFLTEAGRLGVFVVRYGNYTAHVAADTNEGVYVSINGVSPSIAVRVRQFDFVNYWSRWFGTVADHSTDNSAIINTMIAVSDLTNTLTGAGQQGAANIHIEGGVRFASTSLSFNPSAGHIFVNLYYFANSDTTKGVSDGGGGTNEYRQLSVNSGYDGDGSGGMVAEWVYSAPLHPSIGLNAQKNIAGADAHFGTGQVRLPSVSGAVRASYYFKDENVARFRTIYESTYGGATISLQPFLDRLDLNNVGSTGWPTIPANGTIITGVTSGAKGIKYSHNTTDLFVNWVQGTFVPGELVTDGVTTSTATISGGGVTETNLSLPSLIFGFGEVCMAYGVSPAYTVAGATIGSRLMVTLPELSGISGIIKETVTNAALLFSNTQGSVPTTGRQVVLDANNRLVTVNGVANVTGSTGNGFVGGVAAWCNFTNSGGVSTNAGNIASVTRASTGIYAVTFTNALGNSNFSVAFTRSNVADYFTVTGITTAGFQLNSFNSSNAAADLVGTIYVTVTGGI